MKSVSYSIPKKLYRWVKMESARKECTMSKIVIGILSKEMLRDEVAKEAEISKLRKLPVYTESDPEKGVPRFG